MTPGAEGTSDVMRFLAVLVTAVCLMSGCGPVGAQQEDPTLKVIAPLRTPP
jgi:hypothetical protein